MAMTRIFNIREGFSRGNDFLPKRFFKPFTSGPLKGTRIDRQQFDASINTFYAIMGWDNQEGRPLKGKLQELGIEWAADLMNE
jgi:aldehyde:ferredoxin oxidoreductase